MLEALRRGANSWVLKPLLLLLVLAFVVWGVADVFTGTTRTGSLATVGSTEISVEEYQATYGSVMNNFIRRGMRRPTAEEARLRGIDRAVLEDMINGATLDQQIRNLGLALPQSAIAAAIEKDPSMQGPDGRFDRPAFENFLREIGYNERGYLNLRRREELRQQLTQSLFDSMPVPSALASLVHNWREETRTIQYFTFDASKQVKVEEPDEAKLKEVYQAQQRQFVTPEFRHILVLPLSATEVTKGLDIGEAEVRQAYDVDARGREVPERRRVQQIPFKEKAAAETAAKAIAGGKSFIDAAKDAGASEADIDLGTVTRDEMFDPTIADAAFQLAKDRVSAPVAGRFSTVLLRVTEIQPSKVRTFDEMRQEIRDKIAETRANEAMRRLHEGIDDGRAAGKPLKEIAETLKVTFYEVAQVNRAGQKPDGSPGYVGPGGARVLGAAFDGKPGVELEPIELEDGGLAWVDVLAVTEEKQRAFEDVKDDVKKVWQVLETARQVSELAGKLVERAGKGETLTALAKELGARLQTSRPFKRFGTEAGIPTAAVQRAFGMQLGTRASIDTGSGGERLIFRLVEITKPTPATKEQVDQIAGQLRSEVQQDAIQAYVLALRDRFGVRENKALFDRTTGAAGDQR